GFLFLSPEKGARTPIYLASSPEVEAVTGGYFSRCAPKSISRVAQGDDAARRLWQVSEEMVAKEAPVE
ncbi:MAG: short-chain dehydrogenase, partial [Actinomycetota bacterium]